MIFQDNLDGSTYWGAIEQTYRIEVNASTGRMPLQPLKINLAGVVYMDPSRSVSLDGTASSSFSVQQVVDYAIKNDLVRKDDAQGIYFVVPNFSPPALQPNNQIIPPRDFSDPLGNPGSGAYCGWHDIKANGPSVSYTYSFTPALPPQLYYGCAGNDGTSEQPSLNPSGDPSVMAVISTMAHEIMETITDPLPGYSFATMQGRENGDLCISVYDR
jgi:hypothetical protein